MTPDLIDSLKSAAISLEKISSSTHYWWDTQWFSSLAGAVVGALAALTVGIARDYFSLRRKIPAPTKNKNATTIQKRRATSITIPGDPTYAIMCRTKICGSVKRSTKAGLSKKFGIAILEESKTVSMPSCVKNVTILMPSDLINATLCSAKIPRASFI